MQTDASKKHSSQKDLVSFAFESEESLFPAVRKGLEQKRNSKCITGFLKLKRDRKVLPDPTMENKGIRIMTQSYTMN